MQIKDWKSASFEDKICSTQKTFFYNDLTLPSVIIFFRAAEENLNILLPKKERKWKKKAFESETTMRKCLIFKQNS